MIESLDNLPDGITLQADLCIVGAGAAGLLIARSFIGSGLRVILLESGGRTADAQTSSLSDGAAAPGEFRGLQHGRARRFGGTTTLWGGQCIRLDPIDFERRSWVPDSGWPITAAELAPWYDRAEAALRIAPDDVAIPAWERFGLKPPAFDPAVLRPVHGVFIRQPDLGRRFAGEFASADNVRVLLQANAMRLRTNVAGTQVTELAIGSLGGRRACVAARRIVLCTGAIENARLLLLSDQTRPQGLGNDRDLVGRYLQDHPCGRTATVHTTSPRVLQDRWNMLYRRRMRYLPKIALGDAAQRDQRLLNCVGRLCYDFDSTSGTRALLDVVAHLRARRPLPALGAHMARIGRGLPDIAESLWRLRVQGRSPAPVPRSIHLEVFSEQTPDPHSRITLDHGVDRLGLRRVRVDWRLDELTARTMARFTELTGSEFARLGLGRITPAAWLAQAARPDVVDSFHPAGTTRMALQPADGVVDPHCAVFGVDGLYVAGSAVFPTSGAANPTLTIAAMALRLADRLKQEFAADGTGIALIAAARPEARLAAAEA